MSPCLPSNSALRPLSAADLTADIAMTIDPEEKKSFPASRAISPGPPTAKVSHDLFFRASAPSVLRLWARTRAWTAYAKAPPATLIFAHKISTRKPFFSSGSVLHSGRRSGCADGGKPKFLLFGRPISPFQTKTALHTGSRFGENRQRRPKSHWVSQTVMVKRSPQTASFSRLPERSGSLY